MSGIIGSPRSVVLDIRAFNNMAVSFVTRLESKLSSELGAFDEDAFEQDEEMLDGYSTPEKLREAFLERVGGEDPGRQALAVTSYYSVLIDFLEPFYSQRLTGEGIRTALHEIVEEVCRYDHDDVPLEVLEAVSDFMGIEEVFDITKAPNELLEDENARLPELELFQKLLNVFEMTTVNLMSSRDLATLKQLDIGKKRFDETVEKIMRGFRRQAGMEAEDDRVVSLGDLSRG